MKQRTKQLTGARHARWRGGAGIWMLRAWLCAAGMGGWLPGFRSDGAEASAGGVRKLYWFVPDGMRAEPDLFNVYRWAEEGKLPNLKRMMEQGAYGFSRPVFPSHTPVNFATLFTGSLPEVHGVNDGPMHVEGHPLSGVSLSGFRSVAKKVEPIWLTLEKASAGPGEVVLLSVPGSTPPELQKGITIRGRWGGWGADFHAVNFQDGADRTWGTYDPLGRRLFFNGPQLTQVVEKRPARQWPEFVRSHAPPLEGRWEAWGQASHVWVCDALDDGVSRYDTVMISLDGQTLSARLRAGQWSEWLPVTLKWQIPAQGLERAVATSVKIKVIHLSPDGLFRLRYFYNNLNAFLTEPGPVAAELLAGAGPMVDFVDNFPAQLIYYPEDRETFLEEAEMSLDWHRRAAGFLLRRYEPGVFIQNIYTPNQMLCSRWWLGAVDPASARYAAATAREREQAWKEVHWLYRKLDDIVGELLARADSNTVVAVSSDHGAVPLNHSVRLNNVLAREDLLKFSKEPGTGALVVDWKQTRAIYLKMDGIYVHPDGLEGPWRRGAGVAYEALRERVRTVLVGLKDEHGVAPVVKVSPWEGVAKAFHLMPERAPDLVVANRLGYGWSEEITEDGKIFVTPLAAGYKQAVLAEDAPGLWTPFLVMGPGVRKHHFLGNQPVPLTDQYPTLMRLLGARSPGFVQGKVIEAVLEPGP